MTLLWTLFYLPLLGHPKKKKKGGGGRDGGGRKKKSIMQAVGIGQILNETFCP